MTYLSQALKDAPPDWEGKNAQFVLGNEDVRRSAGSSDGPCGALLVAASF